VTLFWLTLYTGSRLVVCIPVWLWAWWKRPRGMVLYMTAAFLWFAASDFTDGNLAKRYGLETRFGFWLDHLTDLLAALTGLVTIVLGSREPAARRASRARGAEPPP
jgi:cardiolipin synthase